MVKIKVHIENTLEALLQFQYGQDYVITVAEPSCLISKQQIYNKKFCYKAITEQIS